MYLNNDSLYIHLSNPSTNTYLYIIPHKANTTNDSVLLHSVKQSICMFPTYEVTCTCTCMSNCKQPTKE